MELDLIWGRIFVFLLWAHVSSFLRVLHLALVRPSLFSRVLFLSCLCFGPSFLAWEEKEGWCTSCFGRIFLWASNSLVKACPFSFSSLSFPIIFLSLLTSWGDRGSKVVFFPFMKNMYWLVWPSCKVCLSNCHGLPSKICMTFMGTTSHSTLSLAEILSFIKVGN